MTCDVLEGFVEVVCAPPALQARERDRAVVIPADMQPAHDLLTRYGLWAQDRYQKRRCASAEGQYVPPPRRGQDDEPMQPFMPDWNALEVQRALQVVPMQYRRVLFAVYIPQREHPMAARRRYRITAATWAASLLEGLRRFWSVYRLRYQQS